MARDKVPAFLFYPRDWLASGRVALLSLDERGAYITLLARCWLDQALPADPAQLAALAGAPRGWWAKHGEAVMALFTRTDIGYQHDRLDAERGEQTAWLTKSQCGGRASADSRRRQHGSADPRTNREPPREPNVNRPVHKWLQPNVNISSAEEVPPLPPNDEWEPTAGDLADDDPLETDAAWLLREYPRWYAEERNGARYLVRPAHDGRHAIDLTTTWPDRVRMEQMARTYLRSVKLGAFHNARSLAGFASEASGIDAYLRSEAS